MAVVEAQKGLTRPTSSKLLDYCFAYDPQSRSYTLQITRLIGSFTLIVGLFFLAFILVSSKKKSSKVIKE
jgi:protein SCO1/2